MADEKLILDADAIQRGLTRIAHEIAEANPNSKSVGLIGIQRGGIHLAKRLARVAASVSLSLATTKTPPPMSGRFK